MKKSTIVLWSLLSLLTGIGIGFFASLVKNGFNVGNNSGNKTTQYYYCNARPDNDCADVPEK